MSHHYRGRYTHNYAEYQLWQTQEEAEALRNSNRTLEQEAVRLQGEIRNSRAALRNSQNDVRVMAREQARMEAQQRELAAIQTHIRQRQQAFEQRTETRFVTLAQEIEASEERSQVEIANLRTETSQQIQAVAQEVEGVQHRMEEEFVNVRNELEHTRVHLQKEISSVQHDLRAEVKRRQEKENSQRGQAQTTLEWVETHLAQDLQPFQVQALGLTMELTRTQQHLERTRETLQGPHPELALPIAESAFASFQTTFLESQRRIGVMEGTADHLLQITKFLEEVIKDEKFATFYQAETEQLKQALNWFQRKAQEWQTEYKWPGFEIEREKIIQTANEILTRSLELQAFVPSLLKQFEQREQLLDRAAEAVRAIAGAVDRFELGYANQNDIKSPRLLRGQVGGATMDVYLDLDGTYQLDGYGFTSSGHCGEAARRVYQKLLEQGQVTAERVDSTNRTTPLSPERGNSTKHWREATEDFATSLQAILPK